MSIEGPSANEALSTEIVDLKKKVSALIKEVQSLNTKVKDLTTQLLESHAAASDRIVLLKTLSHKPSST